MPQPYSRYVHEADAHERAARPSPRLGARAWMSLSAWFLIWFGVAYVFLLVAALGVRAGLSADRVADSGIPGGPGLVLAGAIVVAAVATIGLRGHLVPKVRH